MHSFSGNTIFRSMTDLVNDSNAQSPKRKFSFRFPHLVHHSNSGDKESSSSGNGQHHKGVHGVKTRNFSEEAKNVPDLQVIFVYSVQIFIGYCLF